MLLTHTEDDFKCLDDNFLKIEAFGLMLPRQTRTCKTEKFLGQKSYEIVDAIKWGPIIPKDKWGNVYNHTQI